MTTEIRHIIQNKKFKSNWTEYFGIVVMLVMLISCAIVGLSFSISGNGVTERLIGLLAMLGFFYLAFNAVRKFRLLNTFVTVETGLDQLENYKNTSQIVKNLPTTKTDYDFHNFCINVKLKDYAPIFGKYSTRQAFPIWLTVVSLDNVVLINERPEQPEFVFWTRRSIDEFIKSLKDGNSACFK